MLTSFFGKSAPINYLLLTFIVAIAYLMAWYTGFLQPDKSSISWWFHPVSLLCLVFSVLLVDFIIRKNSLSERHNFGILIFSFLLLTTPALVWSPPIVIANVCCLLGFRRIVSFPSLKNLEKKLLDASLWIGLATFFYPYAIIYLLLIYFGLILIGKTNVRLFLIPILGILTALMILVTGHLLVFDSFEWMNDFSWNISTDFSAYNQIYLLISASILLGLIVWITVFRLSRIKNIMRKRRPVYLISVVFLLLSVFVAIAAEVKDGSELLFVFAPFSISLADYIQSREQTLIKELFLWFFVLFPILLILLQM